VSEDEVPFAVPEGWEWSRLGAVLKQCRNGVSVRPNDDGDGYRLLRISAATGCSDGQVDIGDHRYASIPPERAAPYLLDPGDLLACRFNGNLHYVAQVARMPTFTGEFIHPDKLVRLVAVEMSHPYLVTAINAEPTRQQVRAVAATTAGNIGINGKQVQGLVVAIPPLPEQKRIVARVDELMGLLDRLEQHLTGKTTAHDAFAAAAVHHLDA
jgi:type I restriction enzyme, S subunit